MTKLRMGLRQRIGVATTTVATIAVLQVVLACVSGLGWQLPLGAVGVYTVVWVPLYLGLTSAQYTEVSPYGIGTSNGFRTTGVHWSDVVAIEERTVLGSRGVRVVARYRTMRLRAPWTGPGWLWADPEYDAKLAGIYAWWQTHASVPSPPPVPPAPMSAPVPPF